MPNAPTNVPATVVSQMGNTTATLVDLGGKTYAPQQPSGPNYFWLVIDLQNSLAGVVQEVTTDNVTVPASVTQYANNPRYFLFFVANQQITGNLPQGALASFLQAIGAGPALARLEQIIGAISTGYYGWFSYVLAATLAEDDAPGFEVASLNETAILTMQFLPVSVDGGTIWAPIAGPLGAADAVSAAQATLPTASAASRAGA